MSQAVRFMAAIVIAALAFLISAEPQEQTPTPLPGIAELAGQLLQQAPKLLDDELRDRLDELNRRVREARLRRRAQAQAEAAGGILEVLNQIPNTVRVTLGGGREILPAVGPVRLPSDRGAILFRVQVGEPKPVRGVVATNDLDQSEDEESKILIDVGDSGTTWVLLDLENVPKNRTSQRIDFKAGDAIYRMPLELTTPAPGRLRLIVRSSDTNEPTPAMVRLLSRVDDRTRRPANAVQIDVQFNGLGRGGSERAIRAPGRRAGEYYCVPGPLDMELPAGDYDVAIRRGCEHLPVFDSVTVEAGRTAEKSYTPRRWVDMRQLGWYSGDDHVHARILSDTDAERLMTYALAEDIHLVNVLKVGDISRTWFEQRGFGRDYRVVRGDYVLSPGQECPRTRNQLGHTISLNTPQMFRDTDRYYLYDWVFDQVHAAGGLTGYAHVNTNQYHADRDMTVNVPKGKVDFAEVLQFGNLGTEVYYRFLNAGFKLTASAGSDVPWGGTIGEVRVYARVGRQPFSADAWFEAMRRGRTFVTNGPMLEFTVDGAGPGDEILVKENRRLRVKARAWGAPEWMTPSRLEIVRHGEPFKVVEPEQPGQRELSIDFEVDTGYGFWIAARATGSNGEHALTTPVYVVREGLRFWKYDQVDELVARAMTALNEIEKTVTDARKLDVEGRIEDNRTLRQLAAQGPQLLERVAAARKIWQALKKTAETEARLRK